LANFKKLLLPGVISISACAGARLASG